MVDGRYLYSLSHLAIPSVLFQTKVPVLVSFLLLCSNTMTKEIYRRKNLIRFNLAEG